MTKYNYETEALIDLYELNEDRLYAWLVLDSPTVVPGNLEKSVYHAKQLRAKIRTRRPEYVSPYEDVLPL
jgi:hypothetical protein